MTINIGIIGTGTVGSGCLDIMQMHRTDFARHFGIEVRLARVCARHADAAKVHGFGDIYTNDWHDVVTDPAIDIVVELIGGTTVAADIVFAALAAGKSVVTANKALLASRGRELMEAAAATGAELAFEASVGGGIPIINSMKNALIANELQSVMGIVNGTTNYMLTKMERGCGYAEALASAQAAGYAEADPSADVDGLDAAAKVAILASIAFNTRVTLADVHAEGIRNVNTADLDAARDMGYCVKLLAIAKRLDAGISVRVHPTMLPLTHQLASVNGAFNAIYVTGDSVGETMFFGPGAGSTPTASAVMGDVLQIARRLQRGVAPLVGCTCTDSLPLLPMDVLESKYYLRFPVSDRPGVLAATAGVFAKHGVSVYSVVQRGKKGAGEVDLVYVTHTASEQAVRRVLDEIAQLPDVLHAEPSVIRVED